MRRGAAVAAAGTFALALAIGTGVPSLAAADPCTAVCETPADVTACNDESPVWGFREGEDLCLGGGFGYLDSRESAEAEWRRLVKAHKRRCDEAGECDRFESLDQAEVVCLACDPATPAEPGSSSSSSTQGRKPPCREDEWLQPESYGEPAQCKPEFVGLPPRIALQGRCVQGDCRSGVGTVRWPTGESYVGSLRQGRRHGQGTFRWPDGRMYIGAWIDGQPGGLGTRIFANGRYKAGYFDRGRYLGMEADAAMPVSRERRPAKAATARGPSCEESCTEDSELRLGRINDEYECCYARHAFCAQKAEIAGAGCTTRTCSVMAKRQLDDCDLRYSCDEVQTEKIARFRRGRATCVEGCASRDLDDQGLRVSERGTLYDE
jgi:hypothetical protein